MSVDLFGSLPQHDPGGKVRSRMSADMQGAAEFYGEHQEYRLWLGRGWGTCEPTALWIGCNPSTADATHNDPTITREIAFTKAFGCNAYVKCNVFDYRTTNPQGLVQSGVIPVSDKNCQIIRGFARRAHMIIMCYGIVPKSLAHMPDTLVAQLRSDGHRLSCLGRTLFGHPRHPLYLKADTQLELF